MAHNSIDLLEPMFAAKVRKFIMLCRSDPFLVSKGFTGFVVTESLRDKLDQLVRYCQGRMKNNQDVIDIYNVFLGWAPTYQRAGEECTWTLLSMHNKGLAIDGCLTKDGKNPFWSLDAESTKRMAELAVEAGMVAGYYWPGKKSDPNHFEEKAK